MSAEVEHLAGVIMARYSSFDPLSARGIAEAVLAAGYERRRDECLDPYGRPLFDESVAEADEIRKQVRG